MLTCYSPKNILIGGTATHLTTSSVERHVYQCSKCGATYCPLDRDARIVVSSIPKFAKMASSKYAEFNSARVQHDLTENHGRAVSRCVFQDVADAVAAVVLAKQEDWSYQLPKLEKPPASVVLSLDGTCTLMCEDSWREAMVGTISFYDKAGERQHHLHGGDAGVRKGDVPREAGRRGEPG